MFSHKICGIADILDNDLMYISKLNSLFCKT